MSSSCVFTAMIGFLLDCPGMLEYMVVPQCDQNYLTLLRNLLTHKRSNTVFTQSEVYCNTTVKKWLLILILKCVSLPRQSKMTIPWAIGFNLITTDPIKIHVITGSPICENGFNDFVH